MEKNLNASDTDSAPKRTGQEHPAVTQDGADDVKAGHADRANSEPNPQPHGSEFHDPLLSCLMLLAKLEHLSCTETAITAGLPLVDGGLTPELFSRAAHRAGLTAQVKQRALLDISPLVLPVVILLRDNQACLLLKKEQREDRHWYYKIADSESHGEQWLTALELETMYTGYVIYSKPSVDLQLADKSTVPKQKGHWFWGVIARSWRIYRDVLLASFLINVFALASPLFVMNVYDRVVPNNAVETLWVLALGILLVYSFDLLLKLVRNHFLEVAGKKSDILLSSLLFERVLGSDMGQKPEAVGAFSSQFREFDSVRNFITASTITAFIDLPFVVIFLVAIIYIGGNLVWPALIAIPIIVAYAYFSQRPLQKVMEQTMQASSAKNAALVESLTALEAVKVLGLEGRMQRQWEQTVGQLALLGQHARRLSSGVSSVAGWIMQVSSVVVVIIGVYLIAAGDLTMGALIACVLLSSRVLGPMSQVAGLLLSYRQAQVGMEGLKAIVDRPQERDDSSRFISRPALRGEIAFDRVSFKYPNEDVMSLDNVSFTLKAGERVGIVGRIGSGKSSLHKLMLGLFQPTSGAILFDGIDVQQLDPADLRSQIGHVPQDIKLFSGTIRSNIAQGALHPSDEDILWAAEIGGVTEFVNRHPRGFDRAVGERGESLSGGQRQSISIARAVVGHPVVYLLDEPSTSMDNTSEAALLDNLAKVTQGHTLILNTHKTSLLKLVDRVLVLDQGRVVADGPKEAVLEALKKGQLRVG